MQKRKPVILQILPALQSGGVERGCVDIARALKKQGFEPVVASNGGVLTYQLREHGIRHYDLPLHKKNPITIYKNIAKIEKIIKENYVDIVHVRSRAPMWSAYFACKKNNVKLVSTVHGTYSLKFWKWKIFPPKRIYNELMLKANQIIAVSSFIRDYITQNYKINVADKITIINRGADLTYFDAKKVSNSRIIDLVKKWHLPEDKKIILMPARFTAWKGHEFLIDALSKVQSDFFCAFVGSDHGHENYRKRLEKKIIDCNLSGKVRIVGMCKDMPAAYALSDFVVFPSVRPEAFGRISIEAQACEKIVIATNIGGARDTIIEGETGFFVEPNDSENFAKLIDKVLQMSKEETSKMGQRGRKNIEDNFSNDKMCNDTIAIYQKILSQK
jgi:glycosyltransferase involved in cell wall biosynthesis